MNVVSKLCLRPICPLETPFLCFGFANRKYHEAIYLNSDLRLCIWLFNCITFNMHVIWMVIMNTAIEAGSANFVNRVCLCRYYRILLSPLYQHYDISLFFSSHSHSKGHNACSLSAWNGFLVYNFLSVLIIWLEVAILWNYLTEFPEIYLSWHFTTLLIYLSWKVWWKLKKRWSAVLRRKTMPKRRLSFNLQRMPSIGYG